MNKPIPPAVRAPNGFKFIGSKDIDGNAPATPHEVWNWHYSIVGAPQNPNDIALAAEISRAAGTVREIYDLGRNQDAKANAQERKLSTEIMRRLTGLFSSVIVQGQKVEDDWVREEVLNIRRDFVRQVVEPRHRRNLMAPVQRALMWMVAALFLAAVSFYVLRGFDAATLQTINSVLGNQNLQPGQLLGTLLIVIAGTIMGRLVFFATSFSDQLKSIEDYVAMQRYTGEAANLSLVFDAITGAAAFLLFQSSFLVITIGSGVEEQVDGSTVVADTALSTENIDENWLIALGFGVLVGLSRAAFLGRVRDLSKSQFSE